MLRFTASEDAAMLCTCREEARAFFGGVPEHILFDNAKSVIIERDAQPNVAPLIPFVFRNKFGEYNAFDAHLVELAIAKGTGRLVSLLSAL